MVKFLAWAFAILNVAPILWMVWSSLLGSSEIQQGKVFPDPYPNDVVFFEKTSNRSVVAGTLHGQVYQYTDKNLDKNSRQSLDLSAVTVNYALADSSLYAFSPDEGLMQINLSEMKVKKKWGWSDFKKSFRTCDFSTFRYVPNQMPEGEFVRLGALLDTVPLVENSDVTFAKIFNRSFPRDSSVIESLNMILNSPQSLAQVISIWQTKKDWVNPAIEKLFKKRYRSKKENRELFRWCLAERIPTPLTIYRRIPWTSIWVDRVPASDHGVSIASAGNTLCVGMWWESFPGIAIVNKKTGKIGWITPQNGLPSSSVQRILRVSDKEVLVAHDQGFSLIDVQNEKVKANYIFGESGLPFYNGRDMRLSVVSRSSMLFACGREIVFFDFRAGQAVKRLYGDSHLFQSDISTIKSVGNRVFFGLSNGFVEMNLWDLLSEDYSQKTYSVAGTATSLAYDEGNLLVGMQNGTLSSIELASNAIVAMETLPSGGLYLHWRNYEDLWRTIPFGTFLLNSLVICGSTVLICLILGSLAGYGLARSPIRHSLFVNVGLIWSQVIPNVLLLIPAFLIASYLQLHSSIHMLNSRAGIIVLYSALFLPMATWLLQSFFRSVPHEIEEAALLDGCTPISAFFRIIVPSSLPGILATGIYIFILAWDELMFAWVFSMDVSTATIPVGMRLFFGQFATRYDLVMAAATLSTLPVIILFLIVQRRLVSGFPGGRAVAARNIAKKGR